MEIKKYKKEILTKLVYNINDIINTFQNEKFFQYGNNLFITKLKFINKKKTQYKLILEIKNIYKNKALYIWEWFIDENKNLETFNKFYLKIKALCENKEIDLVNEFENFFILYCPSFIKFHKVLETIILNEGTEVIEFNLAFRLFLMLILEKKEIDREYWALVSGQVPKKNLIFKDKIGRDRHDRRKRLVDPRNGQYAETHVIQLKEFKNKTSLVRCRLKTGRTHQIRVHLSHHHLPIIGDPLYNPHSRASRLMLHAFRLSFNHPLTLEKMSFTALSDTFEKEIKKNG